MKIILFSRPLREAHKEKIVQIFAAIERYGFDFAVNEEAAPCIERFTERIIAPKNRYGSSVGEISDKAVMVCYGGDGTLLEGIHRLDGNDISVVGINSGRLGFLALAQSTEIDEVFEQIASDSLLIEHRAMISVSGLLDGKMQRVYALNEVAVQRLGHRGNILVEKLLLQVDGMRGNDRLASVVQRKADGRNQVSQRFAHPRAGFGQQGGFRLQSLRHGHSHLLLLRAVLKSSGMRKQPGFGEINLSLFRQQAHASLIKAECGHPCRAASGRAAGSGKRCAGCSHRCCHR